MTTAAVASFPPVARNEYLDRLEALPAKLAFGPELWTRVHDEVQTQLEALESDVRQRLQSVPGIQVSSGRTNGKHFFLFTHRTFSMPDTTVDPVVVGMTFKPVGQGIAVEADASGEQRGDCVFSVPSVTVANSSQEVLAAARELARDFCQSANAIAAAITDVSRGIE